MRFFLLSLLCLGLAGPASSATIHVPGNQATIQDGIDAAQPGDTVLVACGTYLEHDLVMRSGVVLRSETGDPACVTVNAEGQGRVLSCSAADASTVIQGLRFTGGFRGGSGETRGGAILLTDSSPAIRRCIFDGNEASGGGGGICYVRSHGVIEDCVFSGNSGVDGGGLYLNLSSPVVRGCAFYDNSCHFWGGAIFCESASNPALLNCTIVRNHAYQGGGIWCVWECLPRLENCLVAFSAAGEGIYVYENPGHQSVVTLACCDVFGNAAENYGGVMLDQTGLNGNISSDPLFCDVAEDNFGLAHFSPCLPGQNGCGVQIGALAEGCDLPENSGLDTEPIRPGLIGTVPNPFGLSTEVYFRLYEPSQVTVRIYDPQGREVRQLARQEQFPTGASSLRWDGRDDSGRTVPAGVYMVKIVTPTGETSGRVVLTK